MGLFGNLFGGGGGVPSGGVALPNYPTGNSLDDRFVLAAIRIIDRFIPNPNAIYTRIANGTVANVDEPWIVETPTPNNLNVKIVFDTKDLESHRFSQYQKTNELNSGEYLGYMLDYGWKPAKKDTVLYNGRVFTVSAIDTVQPLGNRILHILNFGT